MASLKKIDLATQRGKDIQTFMPRALSARYDRKNRRIVIHLSSNLDVSFSPDNAQGLEHAAPSQLEKIEISPSGLGIYFPKLDADLYLPAILRRFLRVKEMDGIQAGPRGRQVKKLGKESRVAR